MSERRIVGIQLAVNADDEQLYGELLEALSELAESAEFRPLEISWTAAAPRCPERLQENQ